MLTFTVYGVAQPKGNMRAFQPRGMKFPIVTETNRNVRSWSQLVAEGAGNELSKQPDPRVITDPVRVTAEFHLPRPKKYQRRGLVVAHCKAPDLDKLVRAVLDALSAVVFDDDAQVVELLAIKRYADVDRVPHVTIRVEATPGTRTIEAPAPPLPLFEALV